MRKNCKILFFILSVFILFIFSFPLLPSENIKSLELKLSSLSGEERLKAITVLADYYSGLDPAKAIKIGEKALKSPAVKSHGKIMASLCLSIGNSYKNIGEYDKALLFTDSCYKLATESGDKKRVAMALSQKGIIYILNSKYDKSLDNFMKSLKIFKEIGDKIELSSIYNSLGILYDLSGNYKNALDYYFKSLKIKEDIGDPKIIASTLNNIGVIFNITKFPNKAIIYFNRALKINRKLNRKKSIAITLNNIGNLYFDKNEYKKALNYYYEALPLDKELNNRRGIASLYNNIGLSLFGLGREREAMKSYLLSLSIRKKLGDEKLIVRTIFNIAKLRIEKGDYKKAVEELKNIEKRALSINAESELKLIYESLYKTHEKTGDVKNAFYYLKKYETINSKLLKNKTREKIIEAEKRLQLNNKEKEIELLRKDKLIREMSLKRQRFTKNVLFTGSILLLLGIFLLFYFYIEKINVNKELKRVNLALDRSSRTDPLTGLSNRRDIYEKICYEKERISRTGKSFSLVICDIDDFKSFNDNYGHDCGDFVLKELTGRLSVLLRKQDMVGRWGGEEFLILLPDTKLKGAVTFAEKIRENISTMIFEYNEVRLSITMTFGISVFEKGMDISESLKIADEALYRGKNNGKNRVETG